MSDPVARRTDVLGTRNSERRSADLPDHVTQIEFGVERSTPFDGTLSFETEDQAAIVAAELMSDRTAASIRGAAELVEARSRNVQVRFRPVAEMSVHEVGAEHHTACIPHADDVNDGP